MQLEHRRHCPKSLRLKNIGPYYGRLFMPQNVQKWMNKRQLQLFIHNQKKSELTNSDFFVVLLCLYHTIMSYISQLWDYISQIYFLLLPQNKKYLFLYWRFRVYISRFWCFFLELWVYISQFWKKCELWDITGIQINLIKVTIVHSLADMGFQTLLTLIELTKKKPPRHFSKYLLLCSTISKTVTISQKQISPIMMIARQQANKAHLVGIVFLNNAISVSIYVQRYLCKRTETTWGSHQHEAVYSYSTDTVYISIIHKHRRSPCLKMNTSETYQQLLDVARRPPATRFSLHSTSQKAETDQKKNKLNYCNKYCTI